MVVTVVNDALADHAIAALRRARENPAEPLFLAVGFVRPHLPFSVPQKYWDLYDPDKIPLPAIDHLPAGAPEFAGHNNSELHNYPGVPKGNPIPADFAKQLRHGYYAAVSFTDHNVGRLLDALDAEGLANNTVVVLWGDHGWHLGDHGMWTKHTNYEEANHIPLLIVAPGVTQPGTRTNAMTETVDLYPTLAELAGLPAPWRLVSYHQHHLSVFERRKGRHPRGN